VFTSEEKTNDVIQLILLQFVDESVLVSVLIWCVIKQSCRIRAALCGSGWPRPHIDGDYHGWFEAWESFTDCSTLCFVEVL